MQRNLANKDTFRPEQSVRNRDVSSLHGFLFKNVGLLTGRGALISEVPVPIIGKQNQNCLKLMSHVGLEVDIFKLEARSFFALPASSFLLPPLSYSPLLSLSPLLLLQLCFLLLLSLPFLETAQVICACEDSAPPLRPFMSGLESWYLVSQQP